MISQPFTQCIKKWRNADNIVGNLAKKCDDWSTERKSKCFTAGTQIVVGMGQIEDESGNLTTVYTTANIEDIQVGDLVYSYNTQTGETELAKVTSTVALSSDHINYLTIIDDNGNEQVIETTDAHPFWVVTDDPDLERAASEVVDENGVILYHENLEPGLNGFWVEAKDLQIGDVFLGANGESSTLTNIVHIEQEGGIAVFNFTVEGNHNYFILAKEYENGQTCVLVHNAWCNISQRKLQHEYKHASEFGVTGPWNKQNSEAFSQAIQDHLNKPTVQQIQGTYRGNIPVTHYYEPGTDLNVMVDMNNDLVGAWKLSGPQRICLQNIGNVQ